MSTNQIHLLFVFILPIICSSVIPEERDGELCPDQATPLENEPKCSMEYDLLDDSYCPTQPSGICYKGHCCPPLKYSNGSLILGKKEYITSIKCTNAPPIGYKYAYCSPTIDKVVILGKYDNHGKKLGWTNRFCNYNHDCSSVQQYVCASRAGNSKRCLKNSELKAPLKEAFNQTDIDYYIKTCYFVMIVFLLTATMRIYAE